LEGQELAQDHALLGIVLSITLPARVNNCDEALTIVIIYKGIGLRFGQDAVGRTHLSQAVKPTLKHHDILLLATAIIFIYFLI
jgi:hypothetical protein